MSTYKLNKRVEIWRPVTKPNDFDGGTPPRELASVEWAEIKHLQSRDLVDVQQVYPGATVQAIVRQGSSRITAGMVARVNGVDHPIRGVGAIDDGEQYRRLLLEVPPEHVGMSYR